MNPNVRVRNIARQVARKIFFDGTTNYLSQVNSIIPVVRQVMQEGHFDVVDVAHARTLKRMDDAVVASIRKRNGLEGGEFSESP